MSQLAFYMQKSEVEQRLRLRSQMVSIEDFWDFRLGTSAVRVVLCFNEYGNESILPMHIMRDRDMATLWDLTNAKHLQRERPFVGEEGGGTRSYGVSHFRSFMPPAEMLRR